MALLGILQPKPKCPKCGSLKVKVKFKKLESSGQSSITKKIIECEKCGYKG